MAAIRAGAVIRVLTPMLPGAISVVRLSGPRAVAILDRVFTPAGVRRLRSLPSQQLCYGQLIEAGEPLDDVVVAVAASGTDEAVVDISAHGGVRVVQRIVTLLERLGAVAAEPNPESDDTWPADSAVQREIDALMPHARTPRVAVWLAAQRVVLPAALREVADRLSHGDVAEATTALEAMAERYRGARRRIDGVTVVLAGPVNAGKSTLANRLAGREHSIATDQPGTTRDWVTGRASADGVPIELVDTAGVRKPAECLERAAIRRGLCQAEAADVVLWIIDGTTSPPDPTEWLDAMKGFPARRIAVINKSDAGVVVGSRDLPPGLAERTVVVSAVSGQGLNTLVGEILNVSGLADWADETPCLLTARQREAVTCVLSMLPANAGIAAGWVRDELLGAGLADPSE